MTNDLISRSSLKEKIDFVFPYDPLADYEENIGEVMKLIDNAPTVIACSPDEVKAIVESMVNLATKNALENRSNGEWILKETDCDDGGNNRYECNNCHYTDIHSSSADVPFCWHCGAKMKGGAE